MRHLASETVDDERMPSFAEAKPSLFWRRLVLRKYDVDYFECGTVWQPTDAAAPIGWTKAYATGGTGAGHRGLPKKRRHRAHDVQQRLELLKFPRGGRCPRLWRWTWALRANDA